MGIHRLVASALVVLAFAGCESERVSFAGPGEAPSGPVSRSQQPDPEPSPVRRTVFDSSREPFPDVVPGQATVGLRIRAQVNGVPIFDDEVRAACYIPLQATLSLPEPQRSAKQKEIVQSQLQELIEREIVLQDAFARLAKNGSPYLEKLKTAASKDFEKMMRQMKTQSKAKSDEDLKNMMRSQGLSLEGMRRQNERHFMAREYMRSRVYPMVERIGREQIVEYYQEHPNEFQTVDAVKWQDIFIDASKFGNRQQARVFAEQVAARARAGEDFAKLAQYDNGDSAYRNGEGFGRLRTEIRPREAEPILFQMHDGETGPVVEIPTGFHVIRLVHRDQGGQLPLDEKTQADIRRKLQNQIAEKEVKRLVNELKEKASIEIANSVP